MAFFPTNFFQASITFCFLVDHFLYFLNFGNTLIFFTVLGYIDILFQDCQVWKNITKE